MPCFVSPYQVNIQTILPPSELGVIVFSFFLLLVMCGTYSVTTRSPCKQSQQIVCLASQFTTAFFFNYSLSLSILCFVCNVHIGIPLTTTYINIYIVFTKLQCVTIHCFIIILISDNLCTMFLVTTFVLCKCCTEQTSCYLTHNLPVALNKIHYDTLLLSLLHAIDES